MKKKSQVLLLKDIEGHGRSGDVTLEAGGFVRNYLIPQGFAVYATPANLAMQARLQEERKIQAAKDKQEAEALRDKLLGLALEVKVKVDPEGHMYGSVNVHDIQELIQKAIGVHIDKKCVLLKHPIKDVGDHSLSFRMQEGVMAEGIILKVISDQDAPAVNA